MKRGRRFHYNLTPYFIPSASNLSLRLKHFFLPIRKTMRLIFSLLSFLLSTHSISGFAPDDKLLLRKMTQLPVSTSAEAMTKESLFGKSTVNSGICRFFDNLDSDVISHRFVCLSFS